MKSKKQKRERESQREEERNEEKEQLSKTPQLVLSANENDCNKIWNFLGFNLIDNEKCN